MGLIFITGAIALFVLIFVISGFKIVQQAEVMVIERLGKYRCLESFAKEYESHKSYLSLRLIKCKQSKSK